MAFLIAGECVSNSWAVGPLPADFPDRETSLNAASARATRQASAILNWRRRLRLICLLLALPVLMCAGISAQTAATFSAVVTRVTGLKAPYASVVDKNGNIFVSDTGNNQVKEFLASEGYATAHILGSGFNAPRGLAVDGNRNVFVADWGNFRIKEILAAGGYVNVNTIFTAVNNYHPDGAVVGGGNNVFASDYTSGTVLGFDASKNYTEDVDPDQYINSHMNGIAIDSAGNLFVTANGITTSTGVVYEFQKVSTGTGYGFPIQLASKFTFNNPVGIAVDSNENVFVSEPNNNRVLEIPAAGEYTSVQPVVVGLSAANGVAVDSFSNLFIADTGNNAIKEIFAGAAQFSSVAVKASAAQTLTLTFTTGGTIGTPVVLTQGSANLDFTDAGTGTCTSNGSSHTYSVGDTCTVNVIFKPASPGLRTGAVQVSNSSGAVVATASLSGTGISPLVAFNTVAGTVIGKGGYQDPYGIALDGSGNVYVADASGTAVVEIPATCIAGANNSSCVSTLGGGLASPKGVAVDGAGNIYVADTGNTAIKKIPAGCTSSTCVVTVATPAQAPQGIAVDGLGDLYFSMANAATVTVIPAGCSSSSCWASLGGGFQNIIGVAVDVKGNVYAADVNMPALYEIPVGCQSQGCVNSLGAALPGPAGVVVDAAGGIYEADSQGYLVFLPPGCVNDNLCETYLLTRSVAFYGPTGIAMDASGNFYVADEDAKLVRKLLRASGSLTFPTATHPNTTDSTDGALTATVENIGNATLTFPVPTAAGATNPSVAANFAYANSSTCTQLTTGSGAAFTLVPAATCNVAAQFQPTAAGIISGSVTFTDNSLNTSAAGYAMHAVALNGLSNTAVNHLAFTVAPPTSTNAGISFNVTVPAYSDSGSTVATSYIGPIKFSSSDAGAVLPGVTVLTAGIGTFSITLDTAGSQTLTVADASGSPSVTSSSITVNGGTPSHLTAVSPISQTLKGVQGALLTVQVHDAFGNAIAGVVVNFSAPTFGATASLSPADCANQGLNTCTLTGAYLSTYSCTTNGGGQCSVVATTNSTPGNYQITASTGSLTTQFSLTNQQSNLYVVTVLTDPSSGAAANCTNQNAGIAVLDANCSLRDAIAANTGGDVIQFKPGLKGTINISSTYLITQSLTIQGNGAQNITINGGGTKRLFLVTASAPLAMKFSALTFSNGFGPSTGPGIYPGGAAINADTSYGTLTVDRSAFLNNAADKLGSGLPYGGALFGMGISMIVSNSYFQGNTAILGGAIENNQASPLLAYNNTFVNNSTSSSGGGGAIADLTNAVVINNTFIGNTTTAASSGGAIEISDGAVGTYANNVFVGSTPGAAISTPGATAIDAHNVYFDDYASAGDTTDANCLSCTTTNAVQASTNPLLAVENYGGPTMTAMPFRGSPVVCAGSASYYPSGITTDQRGFPLNPACVDAGAVQSNYLSVTNSQDGVDASPDCESGTGSSCSLRDAIAIANIGQSDIAFSTALAGKTITLASPLAVNGYAEIFGLGANQLTVDGGSTVSPLFNIGSTAQAGIAGLALAHGSSSTSGGAIANSGNLSLLGDWIHDSTAAQNGGAVYSAPNSTLNIVQSTLSGNTATAGVGGAVALDANSTATVTSSTLAGNTAAGTGTAAGGGGIGLMSATAALTIQNSTISANVANGTDGGITGPAQILAVTNSIVEGNTGGSSGRPDLSANLTVSGSGNAVNTGSSTVNPLLTTLGYHGGTTETMLLAPQSPAFCAGVTGNLVTILTEQRGYAVTSSYVGSGTTTCTDAGATNSTYTLAFTTQPKATATGMTISPAPVVAVEEHGYLVPATGTMSVADSFLAPGSSTVVGGVATFSSLQPQTPDNLDQLTATYQFALPGSKNYTLTATSATFAVTSGLKGFLITGLPSTATDSQVLSFTVTALSQLNPAVVDTAFTGQVTLTSSQYAYFTTGGYTYTSADQGVHTFTNELTVPEPGTVSIGALQGSVNTTTSLTITAGPIASLQVVSGSGSSAGEGQAFSIPLEVKAVDGANFVLANQLVTFTAPSTGASATFSAASCMTNSSGECQVTATANYVGGSYQVTATAGAISTTFSLTNTVPHLFLVEVATDTTSGVASNCPDMKTATSPGSNCSLRDALAAASAAGASVSVPAVVEFAFTAPTTITLNPTYGTLSLSNYSVVAGATSGSGSSLKNLVTVQGGGSGSNFTIFNDAGYTATLSNLVITGGNSAQGAGGITSNGSLTIFQCSIINNSDSSTAFNGGGIDNEGTMKIVGSLISGNVSAQSGGGIVNGNGTLSIYDSTLTGNSAESSGGAIESFSTLIMENNTITGNTATVSGGGLDSHGNLTLYNNIFSNDPGGECYSTSGCTLNSTNLNDPAGTTAKLAPLGSYGGPTQTMIPLPGSSAICLGVSGDRPPSTLTDQRGLANATTYTSPSKTCVDAGAVQTNYGLAFAVNPPAIANAGAAFSPAPAAQLEESGSAISVSGAPVVLSVNSGSLNGTTTVSTNANGVATFTGVAPAGTVTNATLVATSTLTSSSVSPAISVAASSQQFSAITGLDHFTMTGYPSSMMAGTSFTVQVTAYSDATNVATNYAGPIAFHSSDAAAVFPNGTLTMTAGQGSFSVTLDTAGSQTLTVGDAGGSPTISSTSITVNAAAASKVIASSGGGQTSVIGAPFTNPLNVEATDAYGNPIGGVLLTFSAPATGASASLSSTSCTTSTTTSVGYCSVTATANGTVSASAYNVSVTAAGVATPATFSLTNSQASTTLAVTPQLTAIVYGQSVSVNAAISPATVGGTAPTGSVTFYDGSTPFTPNQAVASSAASYIDLPLPGSHTYAALYLGDTNFAASTKTSAASPVVVGKGSSTLIGPSSPVAVANGQTGSFTVAVSGQYSGTGVVKPSGSISYTVNGNGFPAGMATISAGTASILVPSTLAFGPYTVSISYGGDGNYKAATSINVTVQVGQVTPVVTVQAPSGPIVYGTNLSSILNATVTAAGNSVASLGTLAWTVTQGGGSAQPVGATTVLGAGSYTLQANWTPLAANSATYNAAANTNVVTVQVNPATLTVTANSPTITYGQTLPVYGATITGFVNGDTQGTAVTGYASLSTTPATPVSAGMYTITATHNTLSAANYVFTFATGTLTITPVALIVKALNATIAYGQQLPGFSGTITGAVGADVFTESYALSPTPASLPAIGTYTITPTAVGSALANYMVTTVPATLTVTHSITSLALAANATQVSATSWVTLTAMVITGGPIAPTGTVTFTDNYTDSSNTAQSVVLGIPVAVSSGVAVLTTRLTNSNGFHYVTASYSGDTTNAPAMASPVVFNLGTAGFKIALASSNSTVTRGQAVTNTITITPSSGYQATINFSCGTLPAYVIYSFSPNPLVVGGTATTGDNLPETTTVTISTDAVAMVHREQGSSRLAAFAWPSALGLGLLLFLRRGKLGNALHALLERVS